MVVQFVVCFIISLGMLGVFVTICVYIYQLWLHTQYAHSNNPKITLLSLIYHPTPEVFGVHGENTHKDCCEIK